MSWYAIKTLKECKWSVGTFGTILENTPYKEKYEDETRFKVLGPFPSIKAAEDASKELGTLLTGDMEHINRLKCDRNIIHLPVYTNSKSISVTPFKLNNREMGIIYASKERIRVWYGRTLINKALKLAVRKQLAEEL